MPKRRIAIPTTHGGVSRQAHALRYPNQFEEADNVLLTVKDGASKRPGSSYEVDVPGLTPGGEYRLHVIHRDEVEKYLIIYGEGILRIFDTDGAEATIDITDDAQAYIAAGNPTIHDLRLVTIADHTFLLNRTVATQYETSAGYDVEMKHRDWSTMSSHTPDYHTYHRTTESAEGRVKGYWRYIAGPATFAKWTGAKVAGGYNDPADSWNDAGKNPAGFKVAFQRVALTVTAAAWDSATKTLTKTGVFADYEWVDGDQINITGGLLAGWYTIAEKIDDDSIRLETSPGSSSSSVSANGIGLQCEVTWNFYTDQPTDMDDLALEIQGYLRDAGAHEALVAYVREDLDEDGRFVITAPWRGSGAKVVAITQPGTSYDMTGGSGTGRPFKGGTFSNGTGIPETESLPVEDRWEKVAPPKQKMAKVDETTLPIQIKRDIAASQGTPAAFTVSVAEWTPRYTGDQETNPLPKPIEDGVTIEDLALLRNRMFMGGGENIVGSQASDFFNLFIEDSDNLADSDPIEAALSTNQVTLVSALVPFRKSLLIFTKAGRQFELNSPEALTPNTAAITPSTAYHTLDTVRPVVMGNTCFFAAATPNGTQIMEYYYDDASTANLAADISLHVAGYIPDNIKTLAAVPNAETLIVLNTREES